MVRVGARRGGSAASPAASPAAPGGFPGLRRRVLASAAGARGEEREDVRRRVLATAPRDERARGPHVHQICRRCRADVWRGGGS